MQLLYIPALVQVKLEFERTKRSRNRIFTGYHVTTAIFAILSLLSFSIQTDTVPGRMGMLITLYLIQINTYNSVEAPPNRGFGSIDVWFIGMQVPILLAILEYGILLTMKKFSLILGEKTVLNNNDICTGFVSSFYLIVFNGVYWFLWKIDWMR